MKISLKKTISLLLALVLTGILLIPAFAGKAQTAIPVIYLTGQAPTLVRNAAGEVAKCGDFPDGYITDAINDCLPYLSDAIFKDEWDAYYTRLVSWIAPLYEEVRLNANGEPDNGTGINPNWHPAVLPTNIKANYSISEYLFQYDWRLDPCYNADILNDYIRLVKQATQSDKVNILGRCEGACVIDAYLAEYGTADVNRLLYYTSADEGVDGIGDALSGNIEFDCPGVERWAATSLTIEDDFLNEFLTATIIAAENTGLLKVLGWTVEEFYERRLKQVLPEIILASYGTMPSVYAMASRETADGIVEFVFAGKEAEYAQLIEKIENYHNNVRLKIDDILLEANKSGIEIGVVAKYGYQTKPVGEASTLIGDGSCTLAGLSKGATTAKAGEQLNRKYIAQAQADGNYKYISPDLQVDASTCMFKDTTWIIKYVDHRIFPAPVDRLIEAFFACEEGMTIDTFDIYPQYMVYDAATNSLNEMTEENSSYETWESYTSVGYFTSIVRFFRIIFSFLRDYFRALMPERT